MKGCVDAEDLRNIDFESRWEGRQPVFFHWWALTWTRATAEGIFNRLLIGGPPSSEPWKRYVKQSFLNATTRNFNIARGQKLFHSSDTCIRINRFITSMSRGLLHSVGMYAYEFSIVLLRLPLF